MGQNVAVVGNYINGWKTDSPLWLKTDGTSYPRWESTVKVMDFESNEPFEYKYIIKQVSQI